MTHAPPDLGLANERTTLAWQRTALSLIAAAAILCRLTFPHIGLIAVGLLGTAISMCIWVFIESRLRYTQQLGQRARTRPRGGRAPAFLATATCLIAVTEGIAILL